MDRDFIMGTIEEIYDLLGEWEDLQEDEDFDEDDEDLDEDLDEDFEELDEEELEEALDLLKEAYSAAKTKGYYKVTPNTGAAKKRFGSKSLEGVFLQSGNKTIFIPSSGRKKLRGKGKTVSFKSNRAKKWSGRKKDTGRKAAAKKGAMTRAKKQAGFEAGMSAWGQSIAPAKKALKKAATQTRKGAAKKGGRKGRSRKVG